MTDKELFELVRKSYTDVNKDFITEQFKDACEFCQNNPNNGGTGICNCTLGSPVIY